MLPKGNAAVYQRSAGRGPGNVAQKTSRTGSTPNMSVTRVGYGGSEGKSVFMFR